MFMLQNVQASRDQQDDADDGPYGTAVGQDISYQRLSCGQLLVYESPCSPGRSVVADQADQKKNAARARLSLGSGRASSGIAYCSRSRMNRSVPEECLIVCLYFRNGTDALGRQGEYPCAGIVSVAPHIALHTGVNRGTFVAGEAVVIAFVARLAQEVPERDGLAVQPVSGPVRCHVAAVAPHSAKLLPAGGQPRLLAVADLVGRKQRCTVGSFYNLGDGGAAR
jgi:hypothetical protein